MRDRLGKNRHRSGIKFLTQPDLLEASTYRAMTERRLNLA